MKIFRKGTAIADGGVSSEARASARDECGDTVYPPANKFHLVGHLLISRVVTKAAKSL